jgi:putative endonuclease
VHNNAEKSISNWCIYILECSDGTYYTGVTNNLQKRLKTHNTGTGSKYTRSRLPCTLKAVTRCVYTRSESLKKEFQIKKLEKSKKIQMIRSINETLDKQN